MLALISPRQNATLEAVCALALNLSNAPQKTPGPERAPAHVRGRLQPLLCFCRTPRFQAPVTCPACQSAHPPGRKETPKTTGEATRGGGGGGRESGRTGPAHEGPAALTEVQELLHGERRRREARVEVHLARNATLRLRPGARGRARGQTAAGTGHRAADAPAASEQPRQPHPEPRRRSRSPRRQPAAPARSLRAGRGRPRGRGAAVSTAATAPLAVATPTEAELREDGGGRGKRGRAKHRPSLKPHPIWADPREEDGGGEKGTEESSSA